MCDLCCREAQIQANKDLVARSNGMLAPVTGDELYLSVATGHAIAFCRASNAGCKTVLAFIMDKNGFIDIQKLKKQPDFKEMLEEGWDFDVIPAW